MAALGGESHKTGSNTAEYHFQLRAVRLDRGSAKSQTRSQEVAFRLSATEGVQVGGGIPLKTNTGKPLKHRSTIDRSRPTLAGAKTWSAKRHI